MARLTYYDFKDISDGVGLEALTLKGRKKIGMER